MADIPQMVYRRTIRSIWISLVFLCLMPLCLMLRDPWRWQALVALCAIGVGVGAYLLLWTKRLRTYAASGHYEICTYCGYVLHGLPDEHACPECGQAYVLEETRLAWQDWRGPTADVGGKPSRKKKLRRLGNTIAVLGMLVALLVIGRILWQDRQLQRGAMSPAELQRLLHPASQPAAAEE